MLKLSRRAGDGISSVLLPMVVSNSCNSPLRG